MSVSFYVVIHVKICTNSVKHKMPIFHCTWFTRKVPYFRKILNLPGVSVPVFQSMFTGY